MDKSEKILPPRGETNFDRRLLPGGAALALLAALLVGCIVVSFSLGRYPVPPKELLAIIFSRVFPIDPFWTDAMETAVLQIRLPRILLAVLVGGSLSAAGAAYQGVFQNPMAAPDILGASAGAGFGAALAIFFGLSSVFITAFAFGVSLLTVALVFFVSKRAKGDRVLGLILAGIMISSLFQSGTSFIKLMADPTNKLPAITYWLMGSLAGATKREVAFVFWPMLAGLLPLILLRWRLNVITMGDDEARAMGVDANRVRLAVAICATLVTAASVSVSGMIGWVGLVIPHMMRRLVGSDYRVLMPASILAGASFMLIVDNVSRNLLSSEIPIGILTAFVGAPFFLWLITGRGDKT
ncbi:MAG: iron ABC transporter permease [Oscillospiraceae bacterium]